MKIKMLQDFVGIRAYSNGEVVDTAIEKNDFLELAAKEGLISGGKLICKLLKEEKQKEEKKKKAK